jgi:hypothetical protein
MRCPFRYRRRDQKFSFGVDPGYLDFIMAQEDAAEAEFDAKYPTCWAKFKHWLRT